MHSAMLKLLFLVLATFASSAHSAIAVRCDGCNYPTRESVALNVANVSIARPSETIYLMDLSAGVLHPALVEYDSEFNHGFFMEVPPTLEENQKFSAFYQSYIDAKSEIQASSGIYIPSSQFGSIYDISGCPACAESWRQANLPAIANQLSVVSVLAARIGELSTTLGVSEASVTATVAGEIRFKVYLTTDNNGGPFDSYCMATLSGTGIAIDANDCVDSDGNPIPVSVNDLQLRYRFTSAGNYGGFVGRISALGVPFSGGGTVTVGEITEVDCGAAGCSENDGN